MNAFSEKKKEKKEMTKYEETRLLYEMQKNNAEEFKLRIRLDEKKPRKSRSGFRTSGSVSRRPSTLDASAILNPSTARIIDSALRIGLVKRLRKITLTHFNLEETKEKIKDILSEFKFT